jgi:hypothetical protein
LVTVKIEQTLLEMIVLHYLHHYLHYLHYLLLLLLQRLKSEILGKDSHQKLKFLKTMIDCPWQEFLF